MSLPLWAVDGGAWVGSAGLVTTALLAATVACQLMVPLAERRLGLPRLLAIGLVALGLPTPLYLVSQDLGWLAGVSAVRGIGFAILTVVGASLAATLAPPERRGEAIGLHGLAGAAFPQLVLPAPAARALALGRAPRRGRRSWRWCAAARAAARPPVPGDRDGGRAASGPAAVRRCGRCSRPAWSWPS